MASSSQDKRIRCVRHHALEKLTNTFLLDAASVVLAPSEPPSRQQRVRTAHRGTRIKQIAQDAIACLDTQVHCTCMAMYGPRRHG
jgi:hypothetical protein